MANIYRQALELYEECKQEHYIENYQTESENIIVLVNMILKYGYEKTLLMVLS